MINLNPDRGYDIIGDVHGCADSLCELLTLLGYTKKIIFGNILLDKQFLGDLIDRGSKIRET